MRILYAVPFWPHPYTPYLFREIAGMRAQGHEVAVISMKHWNGGDDQVRTFGLEDVPVLQLRRTYQSDRKLLGDLASLVPQAIGARGERTLRQSVRTAGMRFGLQEWATAKRALAFARAFKPDLIDAFWATDAATVARTLARQLDVPFTLTLCGGDLYRAPSPALPGLVREAAAVFPVSLFLQDLLTRRLTPQGLPDVPECEIDPARLRVRPWAMPEDAIAAEPVAQSDDGPLIVGTTGRLDPEKRQADLIEAVGRLAKDHPRLQVRIIGGGVLKPKLLEQAQRVGLEGRVDISGPHPAPQVAELVRGCHIYAQPSDIEGFCLAALEGACAGLPMVATPTGAHEQIVDHETTGFIVPIGNVDALTQRLDTLVHDAKLRTAMGRAGLEHIRTHFGASRVAARVQAMFAAILAGKALPD